MSLPPPPSLLSSCLEAVVTCGPLASLLPSPLPELPHPLLRELELLTVTGTGPVKITEIQWTWPPVSAVQGVQVLDQLGETAFSKHFLQNMVDYADFCEHYGKIDFYISGGRGVAEVGRVEPGVWRFLHKFLRLRGCKDGVHKTSIPEGYTDLNDIGGYCIENSSIVFCDPEGDYSHSLR